MMIRILQFLPTLVLMLAQPVTANTIRVPQDVPTIQAGLNSIEDGDTVLVALGVYVEALQAPHHHFTLKGDVVPDTGDYPRPIIDPSRLENSTNLACLHTPVNSWPVLEDLVFRNRAEMYPRESASGVYCRSFGISIRNCVFDSTCRGFYQVYGPNWEGLVDSLTNCVFRDNQIFGIDALDYPVIAQNCDFSGLGYWLCRAGPGSRFNGCEFGVNANGGRLGIDGGNIEVTNCIFGPSQVSGLSLLTLACNVSPATHRLVHNNIFSGNHVSYCGINAVARSEDAYIIEDNLFVDHLSEQFGACVRLSSRNGYIESWGGILRNNVFLNCFNNSGMASVLEVLGDNQILGNRFIESGLHADGLPAIHVMIGLQTVLHDNYFIHTGVALSSQAEAVDAERNWWSDANGPYHAEWNPAGQGDTIVGNVDFVPWIIDTVFNDLSDTRAKLPVACSLEAFPNPFNATTMLRMQVRDAGIYRVELFDVLGRRTQLIFEGALIGERKFVVDATNLASGIYFARVKSAHGNGQRVTSKIVLLK